MISELFNDESGYLESNWTGAITLQEVVSYIRRVKENFNYPRKLKILTSAVEAQVALSIDDLTVISDENKESLKNYESVSDAFVVDQAIAAALTIMYQKVSAVRNYNFKVFSSKEAARNWLDTI